MRIVFKIGTSTLAHESGRLNIKRTEELCKVISDIKNAGHEVIVVSSGAIGMGSGKLSLKERPHDMQGKQAAAAVGQCELMYTYDRLFSEYNHTVGQMLITNSVVKDKESHENFVNTMNRLLEWGVIPVLNENDTIATEEIEIGDNDTLAAIVAESAKAQLLILLSDVDGLYSADPRTDPEAKLISDVYEIDENIRSIAGGSGTHLGTGGMITKLHAADSCMKIGCDTVIMNGCDPMKLYDLLDGKKTGTRFYGKR